MVRRASDIIQSRPGVKDSIAFVGLDGATFTNAPNAGVVFVSLKDFKDREKENLTTAGILADLRRQLFSVGEAFALVFEPPAVPASAPAAASRAMCRTAAAGASRALEGATWIVAGSASQTPGILQAFTLYSTRTPQVYADIDRTKSELLGVPIGRIFETLTIYMGSAFVNDFNILGRTYRVTAQADNPYRLTLDDVANLKTRNISGQMVPIGSVATFSDIAGAYRVPRYNLYPAAEVQVALARGFSSDRASRRSRRSPRSACPTASASNGRRSRCRRSSRETRLSSPSCSPSSSSSCCSRRSTRAGRCRSRSCSSCRCASWPP